MLRLLINNTEVPITDRLAINRELFDPLSPDKKKSDYSKTFTIPGTPEVNKLFGQIWSLDQRNRTAEGSQFAPDFNPKKKATCKIDQDGLTLMNGFIRLVDIKRVNDNDIEYQVTVHGVQADFFTAIRDKKLSDLDFSDLNHELNITNISDSWATQYKRGGVNTPFALGEGYVYPLVNTSDDPNLNNTSWYTAQLKAAIFAKEIVDKIFAGTSFTYSSGSWFNDTIFKRLIIPAEPNAFDLDEAAISAREFLAENDFAAQAVTTGTVLSFNNDSTGGNFDNGNLYNTTLNKYVADIAGTHAFRLVADFDATQSGALDLYANFALTVNGVVIVEKQSLLLLSAQASRSFSVDFDFQLQLAQGDEVRVILKDVVQPVFPIGGLPVPSGWTLSMKTGSTFTGACTSHAYGPGLEVDFVRFLKNQYTQEQFISSLCKMFNLVIDFNQDKPTELIFKPYNSYFTTTVSIDKYRDHSQDLISTPLGELTAQEYLFSYQKGSDIESGAIASAYGDPYGSYRYRVPNDFVTDKTTIAPIFASTPFYNDPASEIVVPWGNSGGATGKDGQIRILYYAGLKDCGAVPMTIRDYFLSSPTTFTQYPFSGHVDDPIAPTLDISFGMPPIVNLAAAGKVTYTNNNLFNAYWRKFITQITDINSVVVDGWFWISPATYYSLTFDKIYQFEGQNFRLLKVNDYDPEGDGLTRLTFLRSLEPTSFVADTARKGRGYDNTDSNGDRFPSDKTFDPTKGNTGGFYPVDSVMTKGDDNVVFDSVGMVIGNNNRVSAGQYAVIASSSVNVSAERVVVIQSDTQTITDPDVLMIHNAKVDLRGASDTDVLTYNSGTNTWEPAAPPGAGSGITVTTHSSTGETVAATSNWHIYWVDATSGTATMVLPAASGNTAILTFKKIDPSSNLMVLDGNASETIDGATTKSYATQFTSVTIKSDGSGWMII